MTKIDRFDKETRFLSNFVGPEVKYEGLWYPQVENAYQAAKTLDPEIRKKFASLTVTAGEAKRMGKPNSLVIRSDWEQIKLVVMETLLRQKFLNQVYLGLLLNTGDALLVEGNWWHDNFWGDCYCGKCNSIPGQNHLGLLLMKIRGELQNFKMIFDQKGAINDATKS
jgi:ribA/ribD-fused uncharacterized protein